MQCRRRFRLPDAGNASRVRRGRDGVAQHHRAWALRGHQRAVRTTRARHRSNAAYQRARTVGDRPMELLIRVADKGDHPMLSRAGDVITVQPDGWPWSKLELA